ncbi:MAG: hypothetical protein ACK6DG_02765 [Cyanobacteriota bacterium]
MNEGSGDCGEGIKVSVKFKGGQSWFAASKKGKIFWGWEIAPSWQQTGEIVPGIGRHSFSALSWFKK